MAFKFEKLKVWENAVDLSGEVADRVGCLFLARRRKLITDEVFSLFYNKLTVLIKGIQALRNSIK